MRKLLWAALGVAILFAPARADDDWTALHDPNGGFVAEMPETPTVRHDPGPASSPAVPTASYEVSRDTYDLSIDDTDASLLHLTADTAIARCAGGVRGALAQVISDSPADLDGQPGRELIGTNKDGILTDERIYFVSGHLYQVIAASLRNRDSETDAAITHFFASFHLTPRPAGG